MRRRDEPDPTVARRFAAVWPLAGRQTSPASAERDTPDAAWRALDEQQAPRPPGRTTGSPTAPAPPRLDAQSPAADPAALLPPAGGRSALGAFDPGRRGVRVLALLAVAVVLVAGFLAWRSRPRTQPVPAVSVSAVASASAESVGPAGLIVVAVQGRVIHPGLYRLPAGARVADALAAAGGALPGVDLSFVNLARRLVDGELLLIGVTPPPDQPGAASSPAGKVNLNTATLEQLDALPGVGPATAQRIVDFRAKHNGFRSVDELRHVEGIGDAKFAQLKDLVTV